MKAATWPRGNPLEERLLAGLPALLRPGDLVVVNDAATLPASLRGKTGDGAPVEVRLLKSHADGSWEAILFGAGDWHQRTEDRPPPPRLAEGAALAFDAGLGATVEAVSLHSPRWVTLRFDRADAALWSALYRVGAPIQYSYLRAPLHLWHVQSAYASRPWAVESPSAGRPLTWELLTALRRRGVAVRALTHAAGLSSTGDDRLDLQLPTAERYDIPAGTVAELHATRRRGGRILAVGTTVTRALEGSAARHGDVVAGPGETDLRLDAGFRPRVVHGLLTGMHELSSSHFRLLQAFAPAPLLQRAYAHAEEVGYLGHEFGDSNLILP